MLFPRAERRRREALQLLARPVLIEGDATELVALLTEEARASGIEVLTPSAPAPERAELARVIVLAVEGRGRRSSFTRAAEMLRAIEPALTPDAVRIVVIQSGRSRAMPPRLKRRLTDEILFQVSLAFPQLLPQRKWRSIRLRAGLAALDAAGLRILRFG
ncbi:MAG: hypothetical protein KF761_13275 [Salinibacterium sp.]|nr:hypothetical protein [Salinibacterium sp.]